MALSPTRRGELLVLCGALLWSTGGAGIKLLSAGHSAMAISAARSGLCGLLFVAMLRGNVLRLGIGLGATLLGAAIYCSVVTLFVIANHHTSAANAILLQYAAPLWVALGAWMLGEERPSVRQAWAMALGFGGIVLCAWPGLSLLGEGRGASERLLGDGAALLSGVVFAALILFIRRMNHRHAPGSGPEPALAVLVWGNLVALAIGVPALWREADVIASQGFGGRELAALLWLGFGQLGGGYFFFQRGMRTTPAVTASLLSLVEPVCNPIWVALIIGEVPVLTTWLGGALVLASVTIAFTAAPPRE